MVEKAAPTGGDLKTVFLIFSAQKPEMDTKQFAKFCRDTKMLDKKVTQNSADISFSNNWNKPTKKLTYEGLQKVIQEFAKQKGTTYEALVEKIVQTSGPTYEGTKAEKVRLHDDTSSYTGVYAQGGPSTVDKTAGGLAAHLDRGEADVRGVKK